MRRPIAWWLVALLFALSLAFLIKGEHSEVRKLQVSGTSYYVDAIAGNDNNTGTDRGRPWKTLIKVNETTFHPGDRLLMKSGSVWSGQPSREELGVVVKREFGTNSTNVTYVEAEGDVSWQTVVDAIDVVHAIPADVILVTKAPEKSHPRRTP